MGKKIAIIFTICIWIMLSAFSCCFVAQKSVHEIQNAYTANYRNDYLYGIEIYDNKYYIFCVNTETNEQQYFTYPIIDENGVVSLMDLVMGKDGQLYVYYSLLRRDTSDANDIKTIAHCDFDKKTIIPKWDLKDIVDDNYFQLRSQKDGQLILETFDSTTSTLKQFYLNEDGTSSSKATIQLHETVHSLMSQDDVIWEKTNTGDIIKIEPDGSTKNIFINDGSKISRQNTHFTFQEDELHFYNVDTEQNYKVTKATDYKELELCPGHQSITAESFDVSDVYIIAEEDDIYVGTLTLDDGRSVPVIYGEKEYVLDQLTWPIGKSIITAFLAILGTTAVFLLYIYIFSRMLRRKDGAPVLGIAVMVMIPIIGLSMTNLFYVMDRQLPDEKEQKIQQLAAVNDILQGKIDIEQLEKVRMEEENTYAEASYYSYELIEPQTIENLETGSEEAVNNAMASHLYHYKDGELFSLSLSYQQNLSMEYQMPATNYLSLKEAAEIGKTVYTEYSNYLGSYLTVFAPIKNNNGEVIGVLETSASSLLLEMNILSNSQTIKKLFFGAGTLLFLLILLVFWINTRDLKILRQAMTRMAEGDLHARANIQGNHEVAVIAKRFDHMAALIENRVAEMESYQNKYEAFVPSKPFYLLRKNGIRGALSGDGKDFIASVLTINTYDEYETDNLYEKGFCAYNAYLSKQIPVIHTYGGVVNKIFRYGENVVFTKEVQQHAVECAIAVLERLKETEEVFFAGIAEEELRFGVIGLPKRRVTTMISEHGSLSLFLQQMAGRLGTPILITGRAASRIPNFSTYYRTRVIGYLHMTSSNKLEAIYEILNGDSQERQRLKMDTKSELEDGIRLFMSKSYAYARRRFIHVLQQDPKDGVAKEYILLCERLIHSDKEEPWLDQF